MKAHELSDYLLKCPNLPVVINGWGSDEGDAFEVAGAFLITSEDDNNKQQIGLAYYNITINAKKEWSMKSERIDV
jgi:hypothetical protein